MGHGSLATLRDKERGAEQSRVHAESWREARQSRLQTGPRVTRDGSPTRAGP